jgi:hypothetical protein
MFIHIKNINYFVIPDGKSIFEIYREIFSRMNLRWMPDSERRLIMREIRTQIEEFTS